ncbi:MAG: beta-galactosidase [Bacteroidaceae bacterium]|nr:beta-galactosidase [Bacteroidaceae bacterium]
MKRILTTLIISTLLLSHNVHAQSTFKFGTSTSPDGQTILVDKDGFIINGKHTIPVMGEMHYARVPQSDWRREIRKMKAGGITILSTYVFWIHHEPEEGVWNWEGNNDLRRFIETCREEQMPVVLRVGPFCHGEVYQGGFPTWLVTKAQTDAKNYKLRTTASGFLKATENLYNNIYAQVNGLLWKDGGPIVGMQIENECRGPWGYYSALKEMALKAGFDLPFYTRTGWPKLNGKEVFGELLPLYGDYADGFWDRKLTDMPGDYPAAFIMKDTRLSGVIATEALGTNQDTKMEASDLSYPYLTCGLGGGMMPAYHRRINMSGREIKPLAICKLGSGSNLPGYYMYHGGTNPYCEAHTMAETQASPVTNYNDMPYMSYDFQSPLGEMGQINETAYHESRLLHQMLQDWGEELCTMHVDTLSEHYARRGSFEFHNDYVRILNEGGTSYVTPRNLRIGNVTVESATAEPFCKTERTTYFVEIEGKKPIFSINGKQYTAKLDKTFKVEGHEFCVLSRKKAYTAFKIDGKLMFAKHKGVLYKDDKDIVEEYWTEKKLSPKASLNKDEAQLREVKMGSQKVAAMPVEADFIHAAEMPLEVAATDASNQFVKISYKGDVARVYADGKLVEDNFWNGKPMLVRLSDIAGKNTVLKILPLGKDYPIYLQKEQRQMLDESKDGFLLSVDGISILTRHTKRIK